MPVVPGLVILLMIPGLDLFQSILVALQHHIVQLIIRSIDFEYDHRVVDDTDSCEEECILFDLVQKSILRLWLNDHMLLFDLEIQVFKSPAYCHSRF